MTEDSIRKLGEIRLALGEHEEALQELVRRRARALGTNATGLRCLELLATGPSEGLIGSAIAHRLALSVPSVVITIDRLERDELVTRSAHPTDGRKRLIRIRPSVRADTVILRSAAENTIAETLGRRFSYDELELVHSFITAMTNATTREQFAPAISG